MDLLWRQLIEPPDMIVNEEEAEYWKAMLTKFREMPDEVRYSRQGRNLESGIEEALEEFAHNHRKIAVCVLH